MIERKEVGLLSFRLQSNLVVSRNLSCSGLNFFSLPFCSTQNLHEFVVSDDILCLTDGHSGTPVTVLHLCIIQPEDIVEPKTTSPGSHL